MKYSNRSIAFALALLLAVSIILSGCGAQQDAPAEPTAASVSESVPEAQTQPQADALPAAPQIGNLEFVGKTELHYAECFDVYRYAGGYSLIRIQEVGDFLVVPENAEVPAGLDSDLVVLQQPLDRIYLAASSAMALFDAMDAVDFIRLSGTQASGWYIDSAVAALESGRMLFAGKYSEPDYELMISEDCCLAIESTMIYHTPKVKEMIEDLDIPVMVDRSSYEPHPLGRTEWIKLYAVLVGREAEAEAFFNTQTAVIEELKDFPNTEKTVLFFYVNSDGSVVIRSPQDYIPMMIEIGGGKYAFSDLQTTETGTAFAITMESFYATAVDADYLIYNGSIDSVLGSVEELIAKDSLFRDFKSVKEGNVWCTGKNFYQATDVVGQMIRDVNIMLTTQDQSQMTFLKKVP